MNCRLLSPQLEGSGRLSRDEMLRWLNRMSLEFGKMTLHVDVDIAVDELFCVRDEKSGEVVQGSDGVQSCTHRLRLETALHPAPVGRQRFRDDFEWTVVDIDGWLDGNPPYATAL
ncbi:unnamed protein product [Phaeothamnion confervicola]